MNKIILSGRLARDPEIRYSQGERVIAVARYTLAVERDYRGNDGVTADFIHCVTFGKRAEFAEKYLRKGIKIIVEGRWQTGSYTNKEGVKVYANDCIVDRQEFCESRKQRENPGEMPDYLEGENVPTIDEEGFMNLPEGIDEELPFH